MLGHIRAVIVSIIVDSACLQGAHSLAGEKRWTSRDPISSRELVERSPDWKQQCGEGGEGMVQGQQPDQTGPG